MRAFILLFLLTAGTGFAQAQAKTAPAVSSSPSADSRWRLVWNDEFNGGNGSAPDKSKWVVETGGNGWGNNELEYYTNRVNNVQMRDGALVITAKSEGYSDPEGVFRKYTSARIKTLGKFSQKYGRFEARIQIPRGQGIWPAFWLLGDDIGTRGWPGCGEIDIMENVGKEPGINHGSLHAPSSTAATSDMTATIALPTGQKLSDDFHVYAVEWEPDAVRFYLDVNLYATFKSADWPAGGRWVFDHRFFLILSVAVGGDWPGPPDDTTEFPQTMLVDYVRVYKRKT